MKKAWVHFREGTCWEAIYLDGKLKDSFDQLHASSLFYLLLEDPVNYFEFTMDRVDYDVFKKIGLDAFPETITKSDIGKYENKGV